MGYEEFSTAMTNRSLRTIKTELEFLTDSGHITPAQLSTILSNLPSQPFSAAEAAAVAPEPVQSPPAALPTLPICNQTPGGPPTPATTASAPINEKAGYYAQDPHPPPPAYAGAPPGPPILTHATALYAYSPTDAGDLALSPHDRIAVTEYMNAEWWKGRNERTGLEGIFPRSYVRAEETQQLTPAQQSMSYGNMPMAVAQGGDGSSAPAVGPDGKTPNKGQEMGKKFGKKLGNAAIFGAGATIGGNIVNGIF